MIMEKKIQLNIVLLMIYKMKYQIKENLLIGLQFYQKQLIKIMK